MPATRTEHPTDTTSAEPTSTVAEPADSCALVVIGSGPAGVATAAAYLEAEGPGKVVILTADADPPYERPPLSKEVLAGDAEPQRSPISEVTLPDSVELRLGTTVSGVDLQARTVTVPSGPVHFDRLVVAVGATPRLLPGVEADADVHVLRSLDDARRLTQAATHARTAVVVGSGFIGCEAAASLARRGIVTTLVTPEDGPQQERLGPFVASAIRDWLVELGVEVRTSVQVNAIHAPRLVHLDDGTTLSPDLVLVSVGVEPGASLVDDTGLQVHEGRLVATEDLQAGPGVWVAGDAARAHHAVAARPIVVEHWSDAIGMGEVAGHNAAVDAGAPGQTRSWDSVPGFWSTIGEHTIKYAAWGDGHAREHVVEGPGRFTVWYVDDDDVVVGVLAYNADTDYERGETVVGTAASLSSALAGGGDGREDGEDSGDAGVVPVTGR